MRGLEMNKDWKPGMPRSTRKIAQKYLLAANDTNRRQAA